MRAENIMSTPVITLAPDCSVKDAAAALIRHGIGAAPVVDTEGRLVGMVTEADLIRLETIPDPRTSLRRREHAPTDAAHQISQVMARAVVAVAPSADLADVSRVMLRHGFRSLPVVDGERVVGIVARRDLLRVLARDDAAIAAELQALLDSDQATYGRWQVGVIDGVATLTGPAGQEVGRVFAEIVARTVPGLLAVRFATDVPRVAGVLPS